MWHLPVPQCGTYQYHLLVLDPLTPQALPMATAQHQEGLCQPMGPWIVIEACTNPRAHETLAC